MKMMFMEIENSFENSDGSTPKIVYTNLKIDELVDFKVEEIVSFILSQF